ncbi:NACHT domain-containing protein [Microbacterium profundi]
MLGKTVEGRDGAVPRRIYLEASEDVDDIVVEMSNGSTWYLQCKRSAGVDAALRAAIGQWSRQAYQPGDRLGLVARELRGHLRQIQMTIDQVNDDHAAPLNKGQRQSLDALSRELSSGEIADPDATMRNLLFLQLATEAATDAHTQVACALLGSIVPPDRADAAFRALRTMMQEAAANRRWTDMADWLRAIVAAGIDVVADIEGAPAAAAEAKRQAIRAYRELVSRARDVLSLSGLNPSLGEVHVDDLLKGWTVRTADHRVSEDLLRITRRNSRFVLTGLPGIGKSEALRQLAANLASDTEAPVPVLFDLRESLTVASSGDSITLDVILRKVSERVVGTELAVTKAALRDALMSGNAILIVDGLDEARSRRGTVARDLAHILADLPSATGFLLSTRPSAVDAALQLSLPSVELEPPKSLERSLPAILTALAPADAAARDAWIDQRLRRLTSMSRQADDIWSVPLLATLATLRVANDEAELTNPVELLSRVIDDSVTAWEQLKASHADGLDREMRAPMLTDGFVTIGCLVNAGGATAGDAEAAVRQQLRSWGLGERLNEELSRQVVHFWDERVGVFVQNGDELTARSRQFAELADARRANRLSADEKRSWMARSLEDPDLRPTVQLAAQTDTVLRRFLLDSAERGAPESTRGRAVLWVASFAPYWSGLHNAAERRIIDLLADAAEDHLPPPALGTSLIDRIKSHGRDTDGWHFAMQLVRLRSTDGARGHQRSRLRLLSLAPKQCDLIELLLALQDADGQGRSLGADEVALVSALLETPAPEPPASEYRGGKLVIEAGERLIEGIDDAIRLAVDHVNQLPTGSAEKFITIAKRLSAGTFEAVTTALSKHGHKVDLSSMGAAFEGLRSVAELYADRHGLGWLLRILAAWPAPDGTEVPPEPWRWGELSELVSIIGWGESTAGDIRNLTATPESLKRVWIDTVVDAYGLSRERLAAEAQEIVRQDDDEVLWQIFTTGLAFRAVKRPLRCDEAEAIAQCFASGSEQIVTMVVQLTINTGCPEVSTVIENLDVPMTWQARFLSTAVSIATSADRSRLIERYRAAGSPQRSAVAFVIASEPDEHPELLEQLRLDSDATVRHQCGGDVRLAKIWTCRHCFAEMFSRAVR